MPDLYTGVLIGFTLGVLGSFAWMRRTIEQSKAIRRRNLPDLSTIYHDN